MQKSTFWKLDCFCNFSDSNEEMDPKIGMHLKNWVRQALSKKFYFCSKLKFNHSQSLSPFFFFYTFFFFGQQFGSRSRWTGQTGLAWTNGSNRSGWWRHPWHHSARGLVSAYRESWRSMGVMSVRVSACILMVVHVSPCLLRQRFSKFLEAHGNAWQWFWSQNFLVFRIRAFWNDY